MIENNKITCCIIVCLTSLLSLILQEIKKIALLKGDWKLVGM